MPVYEYRCVNCQCEFELRRSMKEIDDRADCPKCGQEGKRLPSVFGAKNGLYVQASGSQAFRGDQQA